MAVVSLIFRRDASVRIRMQALMNVFCIIYVFTITLMVTHISFFFIVQHCYEGDSWAIFKHRLCIWYIFTAVIGNYFTCVFTETKEQPEVEEESLHQEPEVNHRESNVVKRKVRNKNEKSKNQNRNRKPGGYCSYCDISVSARTHHCLLCEKCVVKRDHHCFFMGVCIGKANHLYFILFTLFMGLGTSYGLVLLAKYLHFLYGIKFYGPHTFIILFVKTILSLLSGRIPSFHFLGLFLLLYISLVGTLAAFGFFSWHVLIVTRGQTTYEATRGIKKYSKGSYTANFKEVFSWHSLVSLVVPFWDLVMRNR